MSWRNYGYEDVRRLSEAPSFLEDQGQRRCPFCGNRTVRQYIYEYKSAASRTQPSLIGYAWCRVCEHFAGSTGPLPEGLRFDDPLEAMSADDRLALEENPDAFFARLDALWEQGRLPQKISIQR
jgi:hypothetical protein